MSIAKTEAERIYQPATICNGPYDRETRIRAYVRGRTAKACERQIDAVAAYLFNRSWMMGAPPCTWGEFIEQCGGRDEPHVRKFLKEAKMILEIARKAVM